MGVVSENFPDISFIDDCTVDEVQAQMIADYQERYNELTGKKVSLAKADPYRIIIYACAMQIYQAMQYADYSGKMSFLKYANEDYLDNLAALRGVKRIGSTAATTTLKFSIDSALGFAVSIPEGTRVTNGDLVYFATDEYTEIPAGQTSVTVIATCTEEGTVGNGFEVGDFSVIVNTLPYISEVMNIDETSGGADEESDDKLRDRIFNAPASYSTAGSASAYEYHVKSVDPTINDVVVDSSSPGTVDIYIICDGGELPNDAMITKVKEYLSDSNIRPLTDNVTVKAPNTEEYNVAFTYYISTSNKSMVASIQAEIETAVSVYNTWQTEKIGRDINPSYLIQKVMDAGAKRVTVTSPSFTVVEKNTIATLGAVTMTYGGLEDD